MTIEIKLYLLELSGDKYYVGQTDDPEFRFSEHLSGKRARWTRFHKPLRILLTRTITVDSPAKAMLHENWMTLQFMEKFELERIRHTEIGALAPDFSIQDTASQLVPLHNYKGKYVLLDFWASWCPPCRADNPNVLKLYKDSSIQGAKNTLTI